jgi:HlyD family secretion protein
MRRRLIIVIVALVAVGGYFLWPRARPQDGTLQGSGTIEATQVDVAPKVPGRIIRLLVREGDSVAANQVVAELDSAELDAQVAQARAAVAAIQARVPQAEETVQVQAASVESQVQQARAQVQAAMASLRVVDANLQAATAALEAAEAALARATADQARTEQLFKEGAVSAQGAEGARTAVATATAQRDAARAQRDAAQMQRPAAAAVVQQTRASLALAEANRRTVSVRQFDTAASRAQLEQAKAALNLALIARDNATLRSPIAGVVLSKNVEVGNLVGVGAPLLTVADLSRVYLRVFIGEPDLAKVKLKQPVDVRVDAFPRRVFHGEVSEISNHAEFTPGNVQTREERVKLVFAVKVAIPNPDGDLKPGLPADAVILTEIGAGH